MGRIGWWRLSRASTRRGPMKRGEGWQCGRSLSCHNAKYYRLCSSRWPSDEFWFGRSWYMLVIPIRTSRRGMGSLSCGKTCVGMDSVLSFSIQPRRIHGLWCRNTPEDAVSLRETLSRRRKAEFTSKLKQLYWHANPCTRDRPDCRWPQ